MKPCSQKQMRLALLVLNALQADEARELQQHLAACEGCRSYLEELRTVSGRIAKIEPLAELPRAVGFHQKLVHRLRAERPRPLAAQITDGLSNLIRSWRAALPVLGASATAIAVLVVFHYQRNTNAPVDPGLKPITAAAAVPKTDFAPTLSSYQFLANESPDKLDEALALQASHNPAPAALYTAASRSRAEWTE